ncbi:MAG: PQQ-binding-like beta-propeller repeat protein, partial [Clostridiales bacterium]|nr:PQQ-binding-like beta-propeller repeat protein [Clostridiales bacterium]
EEEKAEETIVTSPLNQANSNLEGVQQTEQEPMQEAKLGEGDVEPSEQPQKKLDMQTDPLQATTDGLLQEDVYADEEEPPAQLVFNETDNESVAEEKKEEENTIPSPTFSATLSPDPSPTPMPYMAAAAVDGTSPDQLEITTQVYKEDKKADDFVRGKEIQMPGPDQFTQFDNGVFTFRGGPFRQNAAFGTADITQNTMEIAWSIPVGSLENYSGVYWTGQPAIIQWPKQVRHMMPIIEEKKEKEALKEVIVASQDGKIYFIDLDDGVQTREPIDAGYPLRSSINLHPYNYPLMTVGQGISKLKKKTGSIGYHVYDLTNHKSLLLVNGRDKEAYGSNGAMDGTAIIDPTSDTLIFGGENGLLYTVSLNMNLLQESQNMQIDPEIVKYRYVAKNEKKTDTAIEGSVAMYGAYAYFADAHGILQCLDTNTMQPVWAIDTDDNTDATIALDFDEDGSLGLYTVNTLHKQGKKGNTTIRRLDAMSGQQIWSTTVDVKFDSKENGGGKASPVIGKNSIDNMVIFTIAKTTQTEGKGGEVLALDKKTGNKLWSTQMDTFSWSSPVAVYNEEGEAWILQLDQKGMLYMLKAQTGEIVSSLQLEGSVLASPAVYNDTLVVGTTGKDTSCIYAITLQ